MSDDFPVVIHHNPACGTSRNALAMIKAAGYAPKVVEYLVTGWRAEDLRDLMARAGVRPRDWLRLKGAPALDIDLSDPAINDEALIAAMAAHPILVNRPIVITPKGVKLCRPSETVFDLLDHQPEQFTKEDGEVVRFDAA